MDSKNFMFLLGDLRRNLLKVAESLHQHEYLTIAQARVLFHLQRNEGVKQVELAEILDVAPITLGRLLDDLEGKVLIKRNRSSHDRRIINLFLTAGSHQELENFDTDMRTLLDITCHGLAAKDIDLVIEVMEKMNRNILDFIR